MIAKNESKKRCAAVSTWRDGDILPEALRRAAVLRQN
jgi:hypothetical protein